MTHEQILQVISQYESHVQSLGIKPREHPHHLSPKTREDRLAHVLSMCPMMRDHLARGKRGRVYRWLGFMQGILWSEGEFVMVVLRNHNRSA